VRWDRSFRRCKGHMAMRGLVDVLRTGNVHSTAGWRNLPRLRQTWD